MTRARAESADPEAPPKARVRPTAIVRAAIKQAAELGYDVEIWPDGTVRLSKSPQSTRQRVAGGKGVLL